MGSQSYQKITKYQKVKYQKIKISKYQKNKNIERWLQQSHIGKITLTGNRATRQSSQVKRPGKAAMDLVAPLANRTTRQRQPGRTARQGGLDLVDDLAQR